MRKLFAILFIPYLLLLGLNNCVSQTSFSVNHQSADSLIISQISIKGNKITRDKIILREIEFDTGTAYSQKELDSLVLKSSQNLMNRSLFNFANISVHAINQTHLTVIDVTERWYIWPIPIIEFADRNINAWWETRDFSRLSYGIDLRVENFRGRMEYLNFIVQAGYDKKLGLKWTIPYLTEKQNLGISIFSAYQLNKETAFGLENNKPVFYQPADGNAKQWGSAILDFTYRQKFNYLHTLTLNFDHFLFNDSLIEIYPDFAYDNDEEAFFSIGYLYKIDFRDYNPYPLEGYYFDAGFLKQGLGILSDNVNYFSLSAVFDQYIRIYKRWFFAYNLTAKVTNKRSAPYFISPAIGYQGMEMRGYEYYVITGQHFAMVKTNVKFEIIPRKVHRINWIKSEKFGKVFYALYANLFLDMGYAYDQPVDQNNQLANQVLWGTGVGIDFVTYYDLVIRFEYTLNKQYEHGFFINLVAPI